MREPIFFMYKNVKLILFSKKKSVNSVSMLSLKQIQINKSVCDIFLHKLSELCSRGNTLRNIISYAHSICPELREYVNTNEKLFKSFKKRDKGSLGKIVEFYLFGQLPNSDPNPDLAWGAELKPHIQSQ